MRIPRTTRADTPRADVWVADWHGGSHPYGDVVYVGEYPTHSQVLGPDGSALEYEPRPRVGFDTRGDNG